MAPVEHGHIIAVFQQLHVVVVLHISGVFHPFQLDGNEKEQSDYTAHIVVVIVPDLFSQGVEICFIDVFKRVTSIDDLILLRIHFHERIVDKVQGLNLNGPFNVFKHGYAAHTRLLR